MKQYENDDVKNDNGKFLIYFKEEGNGKGR